VLLQILLCPSQSNAGISTSLPSRTVALSSHRWCHRLSPCRSVTIGGAVSLPPALSLSLPTADVAVSLPLALSRSPPTAGVAVSIHSVTFCLQLLVSLSQCTQSPSVCICWCRCLNALSNPLFASVGVPVSLHSVTLSLAPSPGVAVSKHSVSFSLSPSAGFPFSLHAVTLSLSH